MTTRQNEVRRILQKLTGKAPDDSYVARMANIAEAADIAPGDTLFPLMIALEYYKVTYETIPASIKEASAFMLREHAEAFREQAGKLSEEHKGGITATAKEALEINVGALRNILPGLISTELKKAAKDAVGVPVEDAALRFERATQVANKAVENLEDAARSHSSAWILGVVFAAVVGGLLGGTGAGWVSSKFAPSMTKEQQETHDFGAAAVAAWPKLNAQAQKAINEARGNAK
jgi:hypothetical protein